MARKNKSSGGGRRAAAAAPAPEMIEEVGVGEGTSLDAAVVYTTTVFLVGAIVLIASAYQQYKGGA